MQKKVFINDLQMICTVKTLQEKQMDRLTLCLAHSELMLLTCTWTHFGEVVNNYKRKGHRCFAATGLKTCFSWTFTSQNLAAHIFHSSNKHKGLREAEFKLRSNLPSLPSAHLFLSPPFFPALQFSSVPHLFFTSSFPPESMTYWPNVPPESAVLRLLFKKKIKVQSQQESGANIITNQFSYLTLQFLVGESSRAEIGLLQMNPMVKLTYFWKFTTDITSMFWGLLYIFFDALGIHAQTHERYVCSVCSVYIKRWKVYTVFVQKLNTVCPGSTNS